MATITQFLAGAQGAQLFMTLDDVRLKLKEVTLDATNAISPVMVTVFDTDGVTPIYQETFQPGVNITRNVTGNVDYTLAVIVDRNGGQHIALTSPLFTLVGV